MNTLQNRHILLVDDMPSIHEDFRKILTARPAARDLDDLEATLFGQAASPSGDGFELDSAYQGHEGVAKVEASVQAGRPYAMAFVDMRMPPGWDGVETIERLWRIDPQVQIVICTAYSDYPWEEVLARLDVQDRLLIVKKPFDMIEVSQLARTLTAKWELTRQATLQMSSLEEAVQNLTATEAALRQSNKELEAFAYAVSHDLRTPLSIMNAFSNLLAKELGGHASKRVLHYLSRIQASAVVGAQLIDDLLSLAQVSRAELCMEPVDLSAISRQLMGEYRSVVPQREASITVQDGLWVHGDQRLIRIAMQHLLDNAWKFASLRTHTEIEVGRLDGADGEAVFFVRDNGSGFDMAYAGKLFGTFQRLHAVHEFPGTGAGLVTVSRIVGRHGGRVWADSKLGEGATFYFTLPSASRQRPPSENHIDPQENRSAP
ncbi:sensor histidine kinase [Polaromonas jejuensis]|uniref:histidine kinase n=1 Tax=Polaromonas jejuensis TaxID=457502 RepID=A0ABW0QEI5_9BURK|nr:ATP-binding protein [Polaromonas jejuensis]